MPHPQSECRGRRNDRGARYDRPARQREGHRRSDLRPSTADARSSRGQTPEANPDITWTMTGTRRVASVKLFSQGYGPLASDTKIASPPFVVALRRRFAGADSGSGDSQARRSRRCEPRRHFGPRGAAHRRRKAGDRPLRMEGDAARSRRTDLDGVLQRHGSFDGRPSRALGRLHEGPECMPRRAARRGGRTTSKFRNPWSI